MREGPAMSDIRMRRRQELGLGATLAARLGEYFA